MRKSALFVLTFVLTYAVALGIAACGDEDEACPGIVCTDCSASGDCNIQCSVGEQEFCGNFGFFDDPALRCAYCATP